VTGLEVALIGLAAWRMASLLVTEDGPWDVFLRLRLAIGTERDELNPVAKMFTCTWCMSVWTTALAAGLHSVAPLAVAIMAAMTVAVIVQAFVGR
jgi:hypothetical protein